MKSRSQRRPLVFIMFGASGTGKSTLLHELAALEPWMSIHVKGTDRPARQYDGEEMRYVPKVPPKQYDYVYNQYGHQYGIQRCQIDKALAAEKHHFIICNDIDTITRMRQDYGDRIRVVFLLFDAPRETLMAIQNSRQISDDEINLRLEKISVLAQTFVQHHDLFDGVVVNKFGAPPSKMVMQLQRIVTAEDTVAGTKESLVGRGVVGIEQAVSDIEERLRAHAAALGDVAKDDYVFILMAMVKTDPLLADTHAAMKRAASRLNLRAERVDDIAHTGQINAKVLGSIRCAAYVIADLTHERPNVYYELGYAHAFGKTAILTAREGTTLHFDIQNHPVTSYESTTQLENKLVELLTKLEHARPKQIRKR